MTDLAYDGERGTARCALAIDLASRDLAVDARLLNVLVIRAGTFHPRVLHTGCGASEFGSGW